MPANLENSAVATGLEKSVFITVTKKGNAKKCTNYHTIALISHASKVMLKILQARLQQYMSCEPLGVPAGFRKGRGTRDQIANINKWPHELYSPPGSSIHGIFQARVLEWGAFSGSSTFSKSSLNIWKFTVHVLLKTDLENFDHYFASMWDECNCVVVWTFFGTAFLWDWNEKLAFFQPCGHC